MKRPPLPPFTAEPQRKRREWPKTHGTRGILPGSHSPTRPTVAGAIARSLSRVERKSKHFSRASELESLTIV